MKKQLQVLLSDLSETIGTFNDKHSLLLQRVFLKVGLILKIICSLLGHLTQNQIVTWDRPDLRFALECIIIFLNTNKIQVNTLFLTSNLRQTEAHMPAVVMHLMSELQTSGLVSKLTCVMNHDDID